MIQKIFASIILTVSLLCGGLLFAAPAAAAGPGLFGTACQGNAADSAVCKDQAAGGTTQANNPIFGKNGVLTSVVNILSIVVGVAAVFALVVGGITYLTSAGDPSKVNGAKNTILYALIGIAIAVTARGIIELVLNKL